jgi:hypothetical protein
MFLKKWGLRNNRPKEKMRAQRKNVSLRMDNIHGEKKNLNENKHMIIKIKMGSRKSCSHKKNWAKDRISLKQ